MAFSVDLRACASFANDDDSGGAPLGSRSRRGRDQISHPHIISPSFIIRIQARDADAFRELVQMMYTPLVRFARSIVGSHDDAKDVVQDVFALVWELGPRWTPTGDPSAYLFASVRNHALKEVRRRERALQRARRAQDVERNFTDEPIAAESPGALDQVLDAETSATHEQQVSSVLSTLPERYRTIYELRYRRGLTVPAIAEVLGTTVKSAEHLTARVTRMVLERLRQRISEIR